MERYEEVEAQLHAPLGARWVNVAASAHCHFTLRVEFSLTIA